MSFSTTEKLATGVGIVTLTLGTALTLAPSRVSAALRMGGSSRVARTIGLADLAIGTGLLRGRNRACWMTARAALNLVIATRYRAAAAEGMPGARAGAALMAALTVVDGTLALGLATACRCAEGPAAAHPDIGQESADSSSAACRCSDEAR
ncbi:hypothetical protein [Actinoalloteichus hymeniacidonis]|uniref:DUF4267 domain-containing protein n=1 Tax=Actinoalloteichus hymeniacidonis TaxID=340345 RepID=A0AAC9HPC9_9PSEU|nr:hypothetical protein [Actinoalloteichus hymeniacidonis]AOS62105.1 hypothetical protein TL08_06400 [Actinoalloteichus hymeniacidonis]MBB5909873.1 hypothetical protein [Actinoalloteichus hymeniacidonis]